MNAKTRLQHGFELVKYSKDGFSPHAKKVFLSLDESLLCWSEPQRTQDFKSVAVKDIAGISAGCVGDGVRKHVKDPQAECFCLIDYAVDGKRKTIELGAASPAAIQEFSKDFEAVLLSLRASRQPG